VSEATNVTVNHKGAKYEMSNRHVLRQDRKKATENAKVTCYDVKTGCSKHEQRRPEKLGRRR